MEALGSARQRYAGTRVARNYILMRGTEASRGPLLSSTPSEVRTLRSLRAVAWAVVVAAGAPPAVGQRLPVRCYSGTQEGLGHARVLSILQDDTGYLWFGTWEGISRFDGYEFVTYGLRVLGRPSVNDVLQDGEGDLWLATRGRGLVRLRSDRPAASASPFEVFRAGPSYEANQVNAAVVAGDGKLYCVTDAGILASPMTEDGSGEFDLLVPRQPAEPRWVAALAGRDGRLWFGAGAELVEIVGGKVHRRRQPESAADAGIVEIVEDSSGNLLVATESRVFEYRFAESGTEGSWHTVPVRLGLDQRITALLRDPLGVLWVGTSHGLVKLEEGAQETYTVAHGLSDSHVLSLAGDRDDNLWIGTSSGGVCRLSSERLGTYGWSEGLGDQNVQRVVEDRAGRIYASTHRGGIVEIRGEQAVPVAGTQAPLFSGVSRRLLQDRRGDWWIGTDRGLYHLAGPDLRLEKARPFAEADGLPRQSVTDSPGIFEDALGRIWVSFADGGLYRSDDARPGRGRFQRVPLSHLRPVDPPLQLVEDRSGGLWIASWERLSRWGTDGEVLVLEPGGGLPDDAARSLFVDRRGWLWVGLRHGGVSVTRDPAAERPVFENYGTARGLRSDSVWSIGEDRFGRLYFGTGQGLEQLDLASGRIRHFGSGEGLAGDLVNHVLTDRRGNVWIATTSGLSRLQPGPQQLAERAPPVLLTRIVVAGEELPLPQVGVGSLSGLAFPASRNNLLVQYVGLSFAGRGPLRYQYQLEGADPDWSEPTEQRSVNYARLAPGSYRFLVRTISSEGQASGEPAALAFRIRPPLWQRGWFLASAAAGLALVGMALHRIRLRQALAMERVRRQIATDLHDDIGSGLSQIAILSEVARREVGAASEAMLGEIAGLARSLRDAMSDIVWAVDPRRDRLSDLVGRMRQVVFNLLSSDGVVVDLSAPPEGVIEGVGLPPRLRRHLFLIFKEAATNIARHAAATEVAIKLALEAGWLRLEISDNGRGFDPRGRFAGHGLDTLRLRAEELGGEFEIDSAVGAGSALRLRVPLKTPSRSRRRAGLA